ncbi:MAG: hypothetical protein PHU25_02805 [Deltaproteobacteria bacterium]|nr:hypothetical protein [Deltaproteobacteria bacterium]
MDTDRITTMIAANPDETLACAVAHYIAASLAVDPRDVGEAANQRKLKLAACQLGLFGYGRKGASDYKILGRKVGLDREILDRIMARAAPDKTITCRALWDLAAECGIMRAEAGNAADSLGLKISACQLGAF